jgi:serine/threonine protein kinase
MSSDRTFYQTPTDLQQSRDLSLQRTKPPAEVPGYQIKRFLGAGAYGEVWVALDRNTGRKVAIKFYLHRRGLDWSLLSREVEKLRFLSADRYVVQLLDVGWEAEPPYYVMEYVEEGSLDDRLKRLGTLPAADAVELFEEIAVGLAHAHGKGVVHCDLKPANVLIDQDGMPRLADFGQSRLSHEQKPALGTLFFMAPEQADLEAVPDVRWDVYALGAILYTLLVGSPPHRNDITVGKIDAASGLELRLAEYRHSIRSAPLPSEHRRAPGVDRALAEIVERCLAVNPDDRFANVQEVLDALAARKRNRTRLPLMVLGFLGPLLALLITAFFSYRGYVHAVADAEEGYSSWALDNNQFAAQLAAEKVTGQLTRYFELANDEARNADLLKQFFVVAEGSPSLAKLSDESTPLAELPALQDRFRAESERGELERHLQARMAEYRALAQRDNRVPHFASLFVTDRHGTQLASAFDDQSISLSIGKNWAHRSYFHGLAEEMPTFERPPNDPLHIEETHLSAVFFSSSQKRWKVAISAPIFRERGEKLRFEGVLVMTVDLVEFQVTSTTTNDDRNQSIVLVDARPGPDQGMILHHPLFAKLVAGGQSYPSELLKPEFRVPKELIQGERLTDYHDPIGRFQDGGKEAGNYQRRWLAAAAPVLPPIGATENSDSGLMVLVQSDYQSVVRPAQQLGQQFVRNSFWMFVVMSTVSVSLWYIVVRMFRESRAGLNRPATPVPPSTHIGDLTTVTVSRDHRPEE